MPRGQYDRTKTKAKSLTARVEHHRPAPVDDQPIIPDSASETFVRFAVLAHRKASPLQTMLMNHAMVLPTQSGPVARQTREEMRQLLDRMEDRP